MLIAQITDLHIVDEGLLCDGTVPTNERLRDVISLLNGLVPQPDLVIATGDITEEGTPSQYAAFVDIVSALRAPLYVLPGNHDDRGALVAALPSHSYLTSTGTRFLQYAVDDYAIRVVALDTTIPRRGQGELCRERLDWIERTLAARPTTPTLIAMHHPPFRTGVRWIDAMGLRGGRELEAIVSCNKQVKAVICGHVHRPVQVAWAGTLATIGASATNAQIALTLTEPEGYESTYVDEPGGVQLYRWDPSYGVVGHTLYAGPAVRTLAYPSSVERRQRLEHLYAEMCATEFDVIGRARSRPMDFPSGG